MFNVVAGEAYGVGYEMAWSGIAMKLDKNRSGNDEKHG